MAGPPPPHASQQRRSGPPISGNGQPHPHPHPQQQQQHHQNQHQQQHQRQQYPPSGPHGGRPQMPPPHHQQHQQQQRQPQQQQQQQQQQSKRPPPQQQHDGAPSAPRSGQAPPPQHQHRHNPQQPQRPSHPQQPPPQQPPPADIQWGSRSVLEFDKECMVGQGTYGKVYRAREKSTGALVALKKIKPEDANKKEKDGFPITAIREIKILKSMDHPNVVRLKEIVTSRPQEEGTLGADGKPKKASIYMVFEYLEHDLTGLILSGKDFMDRLRLEHIKCYAKQLLEGISYLHRNHILHRDLKGSNLLVNRRGELKIADFGLARPVKEGRASYTNPVITLWYRPPELLLGDCKYGTAADVWSAGCILAELLKGEALFRGRDELDQLDKIFEICGTPTMENWPAMVSSKIWETSPKPKTVYTENRIPQIFANQGENCVRLMQALLSLDPEKRLSANDALEHDWMWELPLACEPRVLPLSGLPDSHEYASKQKHAAQKAGAAASAGAPTRPHDGAEYGEKPAAKRQRLGHDAHASRDYSRRPDSGPGYSESGGSLPIGAPPRAYPPGAPPTQHAPAGVPPHRQPPSKQPSVPSGGGYAGGGQRGRR